MAILMELLACMVHVPTGPLFMIRTLKVVDGDYAQVWRISQTCSDVSLFLDVATLAEYRNCVFGGVDPKIGVDTRINSPMGRTTGLITWKSRTMFVINGKEPANLPLITNWGMNYWIMVRPLNEFLEPKSELDTCQGEK